ncbi:MAG: P1 family peptidase [Bryobacteraceae bacterium]
MHSAIFVIILAGSAIQAQTIPARRHGSFNAITDVDGIRVGQYQKSGGGYQTGITVVWAYDGGAVASAYVPGGWPGGINTDILQPGKREQKLDAAFLTGGSFYGLAAFGGIMQWLEQNHYGFSVGATPDRVDPLVSGAVVFDLNRGGNFQARPNADFGRMAIASAVKGPVAQGDAGAGTGTATGAFHLKAGLGTASEIFDDFQVGIITAVNAGGTPVNLDDCSLRGTAENVQGEFDGYRMPSAADCTAAKIARHVSVKASATAANDRSHPQTTICIVATNANLTRAQLHRVAEEVNSSEAQTIIPFNTNGDGDSIFALATGKRAAAVTDVQFQKILSAARSVAGRAIAHAMLSATDVGNLQSYCSALPSACVK